jgi:hypothetical protein
MAWGHGCQRPREDSVAWLVDIDLSTGNNRLGQFDPWK